MYETATRNGLIFASLLASSVPDTRILARDVRRGLLVKLRRGVYADAIRFAELSGREQHVWRVRAVNDSAHTPIIAAGISAAALWGAPEVVPWPLDVTVLDQWRGGGRSDPGVRRTSADRDSAVVCDIAGVRATSLPRTLLSVARRLRFDAAVSLVDWALSPRCETPVSRDDLHGDLALLGPQPPRRYLSRLIGFASPLSDSVGESKARAILDALGFVAPELQAELHDARGRMRVDFLWGSARIVLEFDGRIKYEPEMAGELSASEVVWREKLREDRIRQLGFTVIRLVWSDLMRPQELRHRLVAAGVPVR